MEIKRASLKDRDLIFPLFLLWVSWSSSNFFLSWESIPNQKWFLAIVHINFFFPETKNKCGTGWFIVPIYCTNLLIHYADYLKMYKILHKYEYWQIIFLSTVSFDIDLDKEFKLFVWCFDTYNLITFCDYKDKIGIENKKR